MDHIYETNSSFQFDKLVLNKPISQGGNFFIRYSVNDYPLYVRPPKSLIKQQFIKGSKKSHCDLLFSQENESFIQWMENLENYTQKVIFQNRSEWFESELELEDIENSFTSPIKTYKSGKFYIVRTNITLRLGKVEQFLMDTQNDGGFSGSTESHIPENTKLIDTSVLTSIINRLDSLEKKEGQSGTNQNTEVINRIERDLKDTKELLINLMFKYELFTKETNNKLICEWGRFLIHFSNNDQLNDCKKIIEHYKREYKTLDNEDLYLMKQFNLKFGIRIEKKK
jgi:hypothetical protein